MGMAVNRSEFNEADYKNFSKKLHRNIKALKSVLSRPGFGEGEATLGAEMEVYLVDSEGRPLHRNREILTAYNDPQLTLELNRYNLEYNFSPLPARGTPFSAMEQEARTSLNKLDQLARNFGGSALPIGILPTLREGDFGLDAMTDEPRYHALVEMLQRVHKPTASTFGLDINGLDPLNLSRAHVTMEGACTSFQLHYRVQPEEFASAWNAIQLVSPVVLGLAANSPFMLGNRLWHETRIPLFQQSMEGIPSQDLEWRLPRRVCFGLGWARHSAAELFEQMARLYPPLIPQCHDEDPLEMKGDQLPELHELMMHASTVWSWNRAIYSTGDNGHLRIEMRSLPAGPTAVDMMANSAFYIGLAAGMRDQADKMATLLPFQYAEYNFYKAARDGIDATVIWPSKRDVGLDEISLYDLAELLLPTAEAGLARLGVDYQESRRFLSVISNRIERHRNGASWQLAQYKRLLSGNGKEQALSRLVALYRERSNTNTPVADWDFE